MSPGPDHGPAEGASSGHPALERVCRPVHTSMKEGGPSRKAVPGRSRNTPSRGAHRPKARAASAPQTSPSA
eukprot:2257855-Alexandrium_andersonii.AAC.1